MNPRERFLAVNDDDPFGRTDLRDEAGDTVFGPPIPDAVIANFPGRWVLLRGREKPEVVADAADLDELLKDPRREPDDVSVFVRDPDRTYG